MYGFQISCWHRVRVFYMSCIHLNLERSFCCSGHHYPRSMFCTMDLWAMDLPYRLWMLKRWSAVLIQRQFRGGFSACKKGLPPLMDSRESEADGSPLLDSEESKADESYVSSLSGTKYARKDTIVKNLCQFHLQLQCKACHQVYYKSGHNWESSRLGLQNRQPTSSQQAANKLPMTSVLFNVGIVEILSCNSL